MTRLTALRTRAEYRTLGAVVDGDATEFCVWVPGRQRVELVICEPPASTGPSVGVRAIRSMTSTAEGYWRTKGSGLPAGTLYKFRLDGRDSHTFPDPASRYQPFGVHGPSAVRSEEHNV